MKSRRASLLVSTAMLTLLMAQEGGARSSADKTTAIDQLSLFSEVWVQTKEATVDRIRLLGSQRSDDAVRELLALVHSRKMDEQPRLRLELVRSLSRHLKGPERTDVVRGLKELFKLPIASTVSSQNRFQGPTLPLVSQPQSQQDSKKAAKNSGASTALLSRSTAAMALAHSQHPEGLRLLLVLAGQEEGDDSRGSQMARTALKAVPPNAEALKLAARYLPAELVEAALTAPPVKFKWKSPGELLNQLAGKAQVERKQIELVSHELTQLLLSTDMPPAFGDKANWEKALANDGTWGLRLLTVFASESHPQLRRLALNYAQENLGSSDENQRDAAAWCISVFSPRMAAHFFQSTDPILQAAVLRQGFQSPLSEGALSWAESQKSSSKEALLPVARLLSLSSPQNWQAWSQEELFSLSENEASAEWIAPLVSRTKAQNSRSTNALWPLLKNWSASDSAKERSATARGLAQRKQPASAGLLLAAYAEETDVPTRRAICSALSQRAELTHRRRAKLALLEIDAGCRARLLGQTDPEGAGFFFGQSDEPTSVIQDREARHLQLPASPDGFMGVISPNL